MNHLMFHLNILHIKPHKVRQKNFYGNTTRNPSEFQFHTSTPTRKPPHQTLLYAPAQTSNTENAQPVLTDKTYS